MAETVEDPVVITFIGRCLRWNTETIEGNEVGIFKQVTWNSEGENDTNQRDSDQAQVRSLNEIVIQMGGLFFQIG